MSRGPLRATPLRFHHCRFHVTPAIGSFGRQAVVSAAEHPDVARLGAAPSSDRGNVIELEERAGLAPMPAIRHERALDAVALNGSAAGGARYSARRIVGSPGRRRFARMIRTTEPLPLELLQKSVQRGFQDHLEAPLRMAVPRQVPRELQLIARRSRERYFDEEPVFGARLENGPRRGRRGCRASWRFSRCVGNGRLFLRGSFGYRFRHAGRRAGVG